MQLSAVLSWLTFVFFSFRRFSLLKVFFFFCIVQKIFALLILHFLLCPWKKPKWMLCVCVGVFFFYLLIDVFVIQIWNGCLVGFRTINDSRQVNKHVYLFVQYTFLLCLLHQINKLHPFLLHEKSTIWNACDKPLVFTKSQIKETFHCINFIMLLFLPTQVWIVEFVDVYLPLRNPSQLPVLETGMTRQLVYLLL